MSASQEKKRRAEARSQGLDKKANEKAAAEKKAKRNKVIWSVVGVVVALAVVAIIIFNSSLFYTGMSAVTIGDESYTAAEVSFFYHSSYNQIVSQYGDYISYIGLDTTKALDKQEIEEGKTWADYFREQAVATLTQITVLWEKANEAGFELSEEDRASLEEQLASLSTTATENGYSSVNQFLATNYGKGLNYKLVAKLMERSYIATAYATATQESFTYTDADLEAYYEENKDKYDNITYISYFASGAEDTENSITAEQAMATAKENTDAIMADADAIKTAEGFKAKVLEVTESEVSESTTAGSSLNSSISEWLLDAARTEGDSTCIETDTGYYCVFYISRDDNNYHLIDVRHILVKAAAVENAVSTDDTASGTDIPEETDAPDEADTTATTEEVDENGYTETAKNEAKTKAESLLAEWKSGAATADSFGELANANSDDTGSNTKGGLYEDVDKGTMVAEFNDWCFDPARKAGDTGIVFNEDSSYCGYHVMYFVGQSETTKKLSLAETNKRSEDYDAWYTEASAGYEAKTSSFIMGFVK